MLRARPESLIPKGAGKRREFFFASTFVTLNQLWTSTVYDK